MPKQTTMLMSFGELYMDGNPFECTCTLGTFKLWLKMNTTAINHKNDAKVIKNQAYLSHSKERFTAQT